MSMTLRFTALVITLAALLSARAAHAETEPWKQGVTPEQMQAAQKLLDEGNTLLLERDYAAALVKYQDAVKHWDHPGIRFNIVRCLVQLDRTVEAIENLERALKFGAAPLDETVYGEALAYQKMLAKQIATISVECTQRDVELTLDGQPLLTCPGKDTRRIVPGRHQVVGKRPGHLTRSVEIVVLGGKREQVSIALEPLAAVGKVTHRWRTWVPWAVVGGGLFVGGLGGVMQAVAISDRDDYHRALASCPSPEGCEPGFRSDLKDRAILENRIAIGMFVAGGAAVVTGAVMLYLNRGRLVYPQSDETIVPSASPVSGGMVLGAAGRF